MKKLKILLLAVASAALSVSRAADGWNYTPAPELTLTGKLGPTTNPYHRIDAERYPDLTQAERGLLIHSSGIAVAFKTDAASIAVRASYIVRNDRVHTPAMSTAGFDLYVKQDGQWIFAACGVPGADGTAVLVKDMDASDKECLMYLPMYSEMGEVEIGVPEGASISAMPDPWRGRIVIFGSSFTHGVSTARSGMAYPSQIARHTGLNIINLGVSGNSKLQPVFARMLADADAQAFLLDAFSNPSPEQVRERLSPFIATVRKAHPGKPIIFLQTIYRERGNFDLKTRAYEELKRATARELLEKEMALDPDLYFIDIEDVTGTDHLTSADGTHPTDLGYYRWAEAIRPRIVEILARYGIR